MANEFKVKNGLIVIGDLTTSGTITINGALAATQSWVTSQAYLTSASLSGYATQSYVTSALAALVDAAPAALDTLNELAAALGDDANFSTTITNSIASKQAQLNGTGFVKVSGTSVSYDNSTYLTSYTETDTLSSVTGRGATTNTSITVGPDLTVQADGSYNYTASRLWLNSHNNYRGAGVHMSGTGSTWFAGTPYTDFDGGYVIARTGTSNDHSSAQYSNALLTVKSSGNVGIGTSNPGSKLSVFGNNDVFSVISQTADTSFATRLLAQYVGLFNSGANGHHLYINSSQELGPAEFNLTKTWGGVLTLGVSSDGTFRTRALYVNSNGYVGVNVNPISGDKFEVAGSVRIHTGNNWDAIQIYSDGANGYIQGLGDETGLRIRSEAGNILLADNRGNVGIGITNPAQKLDVNGNISLGSWTKPGSTYVGLRRADDGSFGGGGDSGLVIESYNHVSPYGGDYSQRVHLRTHLYNGGSNNVLTAYGTNVGIGTSTPGYKLETIGNARISGNLSIGTTYNAFAANIEGTVYVIGASVWVNDGYGFANASSSTGMFPDSSHNITFKSNNSTKVYINAAGNVGVGTTSPTAKLEIAGFSTGAGLKLNYGNSSGTIEAVNFIANGGANGVIGMQMVSAGVGDLWLGGSGGRSLTLYRDGNVGIGTTDPTSQMSGTFGIGIYNALYPAVGFKNSTTAWLWYGQDSTFRMWNATFGDILTANTSGNIGIGTGSPSTKLDVNGVITATGGNSTQWNTAYGWGNHASVGYITSAGSISGNAATATYATSAGALSSMNISQFTNNSGYITGYTETDTLQSVTNRGASTTAAITISREAFSYGGTTQSFLVDGAGGNAALTINAASNYAYLNFAQAGTTKFEIGAEGAATNKGSLYFNHNIQVGSSGAALYIKKSNGYVGILNINPSVALDVTGTTNATRYTLSGTGAFMEGYGSYSSKLGRVAIISLDWNANYDQPFNHGITSTDSAGNFADSLSINSFNDITLRLDSNNNNAESYLRIMNNTETSNTIAYIGHDGGSSVAWFGGVVTAVNDFRAPIFYDSANTGYYGDFASTSVMNSILFGTSTNGGTLSGNSDWGMRLTTSNGWIQFGPANSGWAHIYASQAFYFNQDLYVNGNIVITSATIGSQSVSYATTAGSLTSMNISQFTNNSGYITGYTETDTLASVTGRGASTSTAVTFSGGATITGLTIAKSAGVSTITFPAGSNDPAFISHTESTANNAIMRFSVGDDNDTNDHFVFGNTGNPDAFRINANGTISTGTWQGTAIADAYISSAATWNAKQSALNGTGFVKITGTTISYDNSTYYLASNPSGYITSSGSISGNAGTATSASNIILTSLGTATTNVSNSYSAVYRNENGLGGNMTYAPVLHLGGGDTMWQIQGDYYSSTDLRWRAGYNGTWYAWRQIYHSGNFTDNSANWNTAYGWGNHASQSYATTSYVTTQINNLVNGAPGALDTLNELATALGNDASFSTTVTNSIATKLPLAGGTMSGNLQVNAKVGTLDNQGIYLRGIADATHKIYYRTSDGGNVWEYNSPIKFEYYNNGIPLTRLTLDIAGNLTIGGFLTESSSLKLKENVETSEGNLEKVVNLRPVTYNKIGSQTTELGLIAEEVAEVYPEFVQYDENGEPVGVNYSRLTAALIGAVKELTNQVQELNKKING